jgi:hypothetical protein
MYATFTPRSLAPTPRLAAARSASEAERGDPWLVVTEVVCDRVAQGALDLARAGRGRSRSRARACPGKSRAGARRGRGRWSRRSTGRRRAPARRGRRRPPARGRSPTAWLGGAALPKSASARSGSHVPEHPLVPARAGEVTPALARSAGLSSGPRRSLGELLTAVGLDPAPIEGVRGDPAQAGPRRPPNSSSSRAAPPRAARGRSRRRRWRSGSSCRRGLWAP